MQVVKIIRTHKKIKQSTLANALQIDRTCYSRIENGSKSYTPAQLLQIANELQISINEIFDFVKKINTVNPNQTELRSMILTHFKLNAPYKGFNFDVKNFSSN